MKKFYNFKNKGGWIMTAMLAVSFSLMSFIVYDRYDLNLLVADNAFKTPEEVNTDLKKTSANFFTVNDVVTAAQAFKTTLNTTQIATLQKTYTTTLAKKWSNLPCGAGCRNGIQFSTLSATQLTAAKGVLAAALGTASGQGYDLAMQILKADDYLGSYGNGNSGYSSGIYFISFLNEPSNTGAWMLQFGGHHMAFTVAFNNGNVVGTTPEMVGVEPTSFTVGGTTYTPLANKQSAMTAVLASLTATQLASAKLTTTFSDCLMSPGESNGNTNTMPAVKQGLVCSAFTTVQKNLVLAAIQTWTNDADPTAATALMSVYSNDINSTYIAWTGSGTSGSASTFLNANTNYVRIDGPSVWIEFVCQNGVIISNQIHYHTVWRDHVRDYGNDLTNTALGTVELAGNSVKFIKIYPNPTSEVLNIQVEKGLASGTVSIYDAAGRNIKTVKNATGKSLNIPVNQLSAGNYIITVSDLTQNFTAKFIKK